MCICDKETAGSVDSQRLWDLLPSPFFCGHHLPSLSPLVKKKKDLTAGQVSCVHVWLCVDQFLHTSFSAGISLLVPHGGIAEDTTWEMYMIINQEDSR